jgi:hypothetical protein
LLIRSFLSDMLLASLILPLCSQGFDTSARNDMYELDLHARSWKALDTPKLLSGQVPAARTGAPAVALPRLSKMVVFSGQTEPWLNDLHVFTVDAPRLHQVGDDAAAAGEEPEVQGHDVLALFVPYVHLPPDPQTPLLSFATLAASINYFQSVQAGYVQYFISGAPAAAATSGGASPHTQQSYSPFTRRLSTVTLTAPSLLRGVLRGQSSPAPADRFPLLDCASASCFNVRTLDQTHAVEFESMHLARAHAAVGSAFLVQLSAVALRFVNLEGHTAEQRGAALAANASAVYMQACEVRGCVAGVLGGAVFVAASTLTVVNCTFDSNSVQLATGNDAVSVANNGSRLSAPTEGFGGAIFTLASLLTVRSSSFTNNSVSFGGGGAIGAVSISAAVAAAADLLGETARISVDGSTFEGNSATRGGAVFQSAFVQPDREGAAAGDDHRDEPMADDHTEASAAVGGPAASAWAGRAAASTVGPTATGHPASAALPVASLLSSYTRTNFTSNSASLSGGALFLSECAGVALISVRLRSNRGHSQLGGGGGLFWQPDSLALGDRRRMAAAAPLLLAVAAERNSAAYGRDWASPPLDLRVDDGTAARRPQVAGAKMDPPPKLSLRDFWGQIVLTDNATFVSDVWRGCG